MAGPYQPQFLTSAYSAPMVSPRVRASFWFQVWAMSTSVPKAVPCAPVRKLFRPAGPSQSEVATLPTEGISTVRQPPRQIMAVMSSKDSWSSSLSQAGSS